MRLFAVVVVVVVVVVIVVVVAAVVVTCTPANLKKEGVAENDEKEEREKY